MNIDKNIYELFVKAIKDALKNKKTLTFTGLTEAVKDNLDRSKIKFDRSLDWYAVTIKMIWMPGAIKSIYTERKKAS